MLQSATESSETFKGVGDSELVVGEELFASEVLILLWYPPSWDLIFLIASANFFSADWTSEILISTDSK